MEINGDWLRNRDSNNTMRAAYAYQETLADTSAKTSANSRNPSKNHQIKHSHLLDYP